MGLSSQHIIVVRVFIASLALISLIFLSVFDVLRLVPIPTDDASGCDVRRLAEDAACGCYYALSNDEKAGSMGVLCRNGFRAKLMGKLGTYRDSCKRYMRNGVVVPEMMFKGLETISVACVGKLGKGERKLKDQIRALRND